MFLVAQCINHYIAFLAYRLPDALAVAKKAQVVGTLWMMFGFTFDQCVGRSKCAVLIPNRINEGIGAVAGDDYKALRSNGGEWGIRTPDRAFAL
jgi:hypothetical protein